MIRSMTGFGRDEVKSKFGLFVAEIRTLNHKFLEITPKLPNSLVIFDDKVKNLIKGNIKRGKIYLPPHLFIICVFISLKSINSCETLRNS